VFSGATSSLAALVDEFEPPSRHFVLLIAADTSRIDGPTLVGHAETLIRRGASYVCCWGPDCSRFHDAFDEADFAVNGESTDDRFIFTTWHEDEPLEDAAWFTLNSTFPARAYESTTTSVVALTIGNPDWGKRLQTYLAAGAPMLDEA
jgi:hypothetical protein